MAQTLGLRATSFGASTLIVGALAVMVLTMTTRIALHAPPDLGPPPVVIERPVEPPPPVEHPRVQTPPTQPTHILQNDDTQRAATIDTAPATSTEISTVPGLIEITTPHWTRAPSGLARYYPPRALERGIEGQVVLDCVVEVSGALDCAAVSETPPGWGFAAAAVRISRDYAMVPATRDGVAVEGRYHMRVPFAIH